MDMSKILVVVKFGGPLIFFFVGHWLFWAHENFLDMCFWSWDFFFSFFVMGNFWSCGFGHGKFFGHVILGMGILDMWFWSWEFFGHVILVMGIFFLDMWFWAWEFLRHVIFRAWEILDMVIFWTCGFGHGNFWSYGNFKWDKFRIHLMRSCSTNLNLSWLALMEFALMRQSWMPLVWKWMHDFFLKSWNLGFLWKDDDGGPFFFFFFESEWGMAKCP